MVRTHQPGEAVFRSILPEKIEWKPFPAFPPSARLAVLVGEPSKPDPYVIRVKVPSGVKLMPHKHPEDRIYTVMSGVFYIGLGDQFDGDKVKGYPPGSVIVCPATRPTSIGRSRASTSPRSRPTVPWVSTTWIRTTIRVSKIAKTRPRQKIRSQMRRAESAGLSQREHHLIRVNKTATA